MNRFLIYRRHWLLLAVGLAGIGVFLAMGLMSERDRIEAAERERLTTQSKVVEANLARQLDAINRAIESVISELPYWAGQSDGRGRAIRRLKSMAASMPSVRTFLVMDAKGRIILSNRDELIGRDLHLRAYFQAPLQALNPKTLHVSPPFKSVLNNYLINLTRSVMDDQGQFAGVVSAAIDPVDIEILLNSVRYADDMRAMLVHGDGKLFVSAPELDDLMGIDLAAPGSFFSQHLASKQAINYFKGLAGHSKDERLAVLRTIAPAALAMDKPLVVIVNRKWETLFAHWQRDVRSQLAAYVLLLLLGAFGLVIYLQLQARQRLNAQRLKLATQASGVGIWEFDLRDRRYHWDATMFHLFGLDPASVNARNDNWKALVLPGELERIKAATRVAIEQHQAFDLTFQIRRTDGELRFMRNRAALHGEEVQAPSRLIGTTEDVTERKMRETDLRIAATAFESHESMLITDAQGVILRVNHAFTELFGYTAEEVIGQTTRILQSGRHDHAFYATLWDSLRRDGTWQSEIWNRCKNGDVFLDWLSITAVRNDEDVVTHYVTTHTDITLRKAAEDEIKHLAFYDPLTHLPNRRLLNDRLHQAVTQAKRNKTRLALLFIDLDHFKPVNDVHGHQAGDELLNAVAHRLKVCVRESDTVARIGGDEFVVLLSNIETALDATGVAEKIHELLKRPFTLAEGQKVSISSSTGIALYPDHGGDETTLSSHADAAMYQAKAAGRDRFVMFELAD